MSESVSPAAAPIAAPSEAAQASPVESVDTQAASKSSPQVDEFSERLKGHKEKLKINGKERELSYEELKTLAGKSAAADERFRQAAEAEKKAQSLESAVKEKQIRKLLEQNGFSPQEIRTALENELLPFYEEEELAKSNPEALKYRQIEEENKRFKAEEAQRKAEQESQLKTQQEKETFQQLDREFESAFKQIGMEADPEYRDEAVRIMIDALDHGVELSAYSALKQAESRLDSKYANMLSKADVNKLLKYLGEDGLKKIREYDTEAVLKKESVLKPKTSTPKSDSLTTQLNDAAKAKLDATDFWDTIRGKSRSAGIF